MLVGLWGLVECKLGGMMTARRILLAGSSTEVRILHLANWRQAAGPVAVSGGWLLSGEEKKESCALEKGGT